MPNNVLDILKGVGRRVGDTALNVVAPQAMEQRRQLQRAMQLQRQQALLNSQSALTRQSALNEGNVEVARIQAAQRASEAAGKIAADPNVMPLLREAAGLKAGYSPYAFPRKEGLGPTALDESRFIPQMTPLNEATIGRDNAMALKARAEAGAVRPRAWAAGDPHPVNSLLSRGELSNVGQGRTGGLSFAPPDWMPSADQFARMTGAHRPEATPKALPTDLERAQFNLKALEATLPKTGSDAFGGRYQISPGLGPNPINTLLRTTGGGGFSPSFAPDPTANFITELKGATPEARQQTLERLQTEAGRNFAKEQGIDATQVLLTF